MANPRNPTVAISAAKRIGTGALTATLGERLKSAQMTMAIRSPLTGEVIHTGLMIQKASGLLPEADSQAEAYYSEIANRLIGMRERTRRDPLSQLIWCLSEGESRVFSGGRAPHVPPTPRRTRDR